MGDDDLEREINIAGRDLVFAIIDVAGWKRYDAPPKWVWRLACQQARDIKKLAEEIRQEAQNSGEESQDAGANVSGDSEHEFQESDGAAP